MNGMLRIAAALLLVGAFVAGSVALAGGPYYEPICRGCPPGDPCEACPASIYVPGCLGTFIGCFIGAGNTAYCVYECA